MEKVHTERIVSLVLKAVAVGMSITSLVIGFFGVAEIDTHLTLLGIGRTLPDRRMKSVRRSVSLHRILAFTPT